MAGFFDIIGNAANSFFGGVANTFSTAAGAISNTFYSAASNVGNTFNTVASSVGNTFNSAASSASSFTSNAVNTIASIPKSLNNVGANITNDIKSGGSGILSFSTGKTPAQQAAANEEAKRQAKAEAARKTEEAKAAALRQTQIRTQQEANNTAADILKTAGLVTTSLFSPVAAGVGIASQLGSYVQQLTGGFKNEPTAYAGGSSTFNEKTGEYDTHNVGQEWILSYYSTDQSGKQTTQTWSNPKTRSQVGFAGISAEGLAEYEASKGRTDSAAMYSEIAAAAKANDIYKQAEALGAGARYENWVLPDSTLSALQSAGTPTGSFRPASSALYEQYKTVQPAAAPVTHTQANAGGVVHKDNIISQGAAGIVGFRDSLYDSGNIAAMAGGVAVDVLAPIDLINVVNKSLTGEGAALTSEDYLWAGLDALMLAAAPFTLGGSLAARVGIKGLAKGLKTASQATRAVTVPASIGGQGAMVGVGVLGGLNG